MEDKEIKQTLKVIAEHLEWLVLLVALLFVSNCISCVQLFSK